MVSDQPGASEADNNLLADYPREIPEPGCYGRKLLSEQRDSPPILATGPANSFSFTA